MSITAKKEELANTWHLLSTTYAQAAGCTNRAEVKRLVALHEQLRIEYRQLAACLYT